jgi:hypothetical protein
MARRTNYIDPDIPDSELLHDSKGRAVDDA